MKKIIVWLLGISFVLLSVIKYSFNTKISQSPLFPTSRAHFSMHYISAPMTDAVLVLCEGTAILINSGSTLDEEIILAYLSFVNIEKLDAVIYSDHISQNKLPAEMIYAPSFSASCNTSFSCIEGGMSVSFGCFRLEFFKEQNSGRINTVLYHIDSKYAFPPSSPPSTNESPSVMLICSDATGIQSEIRQFKLNELLQR